MVENWDYFNFCSGQLKITKQLKLLKSCFSYFGEKILGALTALGHIRNLVKFDNFKIENLGIWKIFFLYFVDQRYLVDMVNYEVFGDL